MQIIKIKDCLTLKLIFLLLISSSFLTTDAGEPPDISDVAEEDKAEKKDTAPVVENTDTNNKGIVEPPDSDSEPQTEEEKKEKDKVANKENGGSQNTTENPVEVSTSAVEPKEVEKNTTTETIEQVVLPEKGSAEKEHSSSMAIFFLLSVLMLCIFLVHFLLKNKLHYVPESLAIVFLGAVIGLLMKALPETETKRIEAFSPTAFFLVLLPPIIFESGYNLHKGNFFQNLGSICVFAIIGTVISALVVGGGVYLLGLAEIAYKLNFVESFAFGSLISAVDPVATLAIFQALDVDPVLNMLVFGESILNDAVAIVLTTVVIESGAPGLEDVGAGQQILNGIFRFMGVFLGSAGIGTLVALISALVLKHIDLYTNPSLEFGFMLCCVYSPYALAEGLHLSGIMAILFCGIVMSQYSHFNLSPVTQITMQQTMRCLAFICETCVFAYLGLAIFSFPHRVEPALIIWGIVLILAGRALNIFPLATLCNKFRSHQITKRMMVIMWFSGLRGAIAYALSLHLEFGEETRKVLVTTTLIIVLFTTIVLGGGTMPLMKYLESRAGGRSRDRRKRNRDITLSKTLELGTAVESEYLSELTEEELETSFAEGRAQIEGFMLLDLKFFRPFFIRKFTQQEMKEGKSTVTELTNKWYQDIQASPFLSDDSELDIQMD